MPDINQLPTPALLLDLDILEQNLQRMQAKALKARVQLRPHIKTHKCVELAKKQIFLGAKGITVSTFYEAEQFAKMGFGDITWAFPLPPVYASHVARMAEHHTIRVLVDSAEARTYLEKAARTAGTNVHVWLKVDCGSHRAGIDPTKPDAIDLARSLAESDALTFDGILTHAGHSYGASSPAAIRAVAEQERIVMVGFAQTLRNAGIAVPGVSIGSTPTMTLGESLDGITEIRPGNYCFYDYTQAMLGVCTVGDCALTVLASVVSRQPGAAHFITDAGALALSKDMGATHLRNDMGMGILFEDYERKRLFAYVDMQIQSLSQEHGNVQIEPGHEPAPFCVGDRIRILEHHSCLTAAMFDKYYVVRGNDVMEEWKILRGRM